MPEPLEHLPGLVGTNCRFGRFPPSEYSVYDFLKRHREEIQEMNYNAWAEFSEKVNDDKQIEKAKKKCGMPNSSGKAVFKAIMKSTFLSVPPILFTMVTMTENLLKVG